MVDDQKDLEVGRNQSDDTPLPITASIARRQLKIDKSVDEAFSATNPALIMRNLIADFIIEVCLLEK